MARYHRSTRKSEEHDGMLEPLLSDDDEDDESTVSSGSSSSESTEFEQYKPTLSQRLKQGVVNILLLGGLGTSAAAMILDPMIMVFVAGGICIANIPYAIFKEKELKKIPTLRSMNNKLREDANRLIDIVDDLSDEIDVLEPEADRAEKVEGNLKKIAAKQNFNVNRLVELVKENEQVLLEMRNNLRKRIVQDITSIVMRSDKDNDQQINIKESQELALKISLQLQAYDVGFDTEKFVKVVAKDPSVSGVIAIVLKLLPQEENEECSDSEDMMYSDEESDDEDSEESELYDMFYVCADRQNSFTSGGKSVYSAGSGVGLSLMKADRRKSVVPRSQQLKKSLSRE